MNKTASVLFIICVISPCCMYCKAYSQRNNISDSISVSDVDEDIIQGMFGQVRAFSIWGFTIINLSMLAFVNC